MVREETGYSRVARYQSGNDRGRSSFVIGDHTRSRTGADLSGVVSGGQYWSRKACSWSIPIIVSLIWCKRHKACPRRFQSVLIWTRLVLDGHGLSNLV